MPPRAVHAEDSRMWEGCVDEREEPAGVGVPKLGGAQTTRDAAAQREHLNTSAAQAGRHAAVGSMPAPRRLPQGKQGCRCLVTP